MNSNPTDCNDNDVEFTLTSIGDDFLGLIIRLPHMSPRHRAWIVDSVIAPMLSFPVSDEVKQQWIRDPAQVSDMFYFGPSERRKQ